MDTARTDAAEGIKGASRMCGATGCLLGTRGRETDPWTPHKQCMESGCISSDYVSMPPRPYPLKDNAKPAPIIEK